MVVAKSFYEALRHFFEKNPDAAPSVAVKAICSRQNPPIHLTREEYEKKRNVAKTVKRRVREGIRNGKLQVSHSPGRVDASGGVAVQNVHRIVGHGIAPVWLGGALASAAAVGFAGWRVANERTKLLACEIPDTPHSMVFYQTSLRLDVFAGQRRADMVKFHQHIYQNLYDCTIRYDPSPEKRESYGLGLYNLLEHVWQNQTLHIAYKTRGAENLPYFRIHHKDRNVTIVHDGTDPTCIEVEFGELRGLSKTLQTSQELLDSVKELKTQPVEGLNELRDSFETKMLDVAGAVQDQSHVVSEFAEQIRVHNEVMRSIAENSKKQQESTEAQRQATEALTRTVTDLSQVLTKMNIRKRGLLSLFLEKFRQLF